MRRGEEPCTEEECGFIPEWECPKGDYHSRETAEESIMDAPTATLLEHLSELDDLIDVTECFGTNDLRLREDIVREIGRRKRRCPNCGA